MPLRQAMNPFRTGKLVLFQVTYDRDWHFFEIIFFVILGIFGVRLLTPRLLCVIPDTAEYRACTVLSWSSLTCKWPPSDVNTS